VKVTIKPKRQTIEHAPSGAKVRFPSASYTAVMVVTDQYRVEAGKTLRLVIDACTGIGCWVYPSSVIVYASDPCPHPNTCTLGDLNQGDVFYFPAGQALYIVTKIGKRLTDFRYVNLKNGTAYCPSSMSQSFAAPVIKVDAEVTTC